MFGSAQILKFASSPKLNTASNSFCLFPAETLCPVERSFFAQILLNYQTCKVVSEQPDATLQDCKVVSGQPDATLQDCKVVSGQSDATFQPYNQAITKNQLINIKNN